MTKIKRAPFKELFGWCMFDFANSSYTTVIISVTFGDIFSRLIVPSVPGSENPYQYGNMLWAIALAISYILVVITGPILGAITDYSSNKKRFLFYSYIGCIISTCMLWFVTGSELVILAFILIVISNFFFASGENFASSFLPFLGPKEDLGKISGYAWGIGYFGGIASVILVNTLGEIVPDNYQALRMVGPYTGVFFLIAGIPTFLYLKEPVISSIRVEKSFYIQVGFKRVYDTIKDIHNFRDMAIYLISMFFAMAAMGVVISFAFIYGAQEIHIEQIHRTAMFLLIQLSAASGAVLFGFIQDKIGAKNTFNITLLVWILCLLFIYYIREITFILNNSGLNITVQWVFVAVTSIAGMGLGATQSSSRTIVGLFSPESKSGEFFGLWGLSMKLANAGGLFFIALLQFLFDLRNAFLAIAFFYFLSLVICLFINEKRGIQTATDYKER
ncbi:MAG: MFS transporter [Leptospiraceae bacterium]|nr:MFS transporter [Leptospiraceae bacterium]